MVCIKAAGENAVRSELFDASGEHAWREAGQAGFEVLESPGLVEEQITQNEDGPAIADDVEGARDRTAHGVLSGHFVLFPEARFPSNYVIQSY